MKQTIKYLAMLMVLLSFGLTSASCSDDDDDVKDQEKPTLIGSWLYPEDQHSTTWIWTFNADGTFETLEYISGTPYSEVGQYTYDESTGEVVININGNNGGYSLHFKVLSITSDELVITDGKVEGRTNTLTRVK